MDKHMQMTSSLLKQKVIDVLEESGYHVVYTAKHSDKDIRDFAEHEKNLDTRKYFTVFNEEGYVICRIDGIEAQSTLTRHHIEKIADSFRMFEIKHRDIVLENLTRLVPPSH